MSYISGGLIEAADYNGFVSNNANNVNAVWSTGSGDSGWGQTALSNVSVGALVTATNWASLVNTIASMGSQTGTSYTARTAPVTGNLIAVLSNVATDITNITTNRGNAVGSGTISSTWTGSTAKTTSTGSGGNAWTITFTHTITFPSADQARYFWNAGGYIRLDMQKTSTGTDSDPDWNTFIGTVGGPGGAGIGSIYFNGAVRGVAQTIAGVTWLGTTVVNGSAGATTANQGWYSLTGGAAATQIYIKSNPTSPYTNDNVRVTAAVNAGRTTLTLTTTWNSGARTGAGQNAVITGGTDTTSPYGTAGTAPLVLCRFVPPSTTYLSASWGTPTIAASVA